MGPHRRGGRGRPLRAPGLAVTEENGPGDVVTEADRQAEAAVLDHLHRQRPDDGVVGEEGGQRPGRRTWFVDAIDGTPDCVSGDPSWCSAVALVDDAGPLLSAVHHHAGGALFSAARGAGPWPGAAPLTRGPGPGLGRATLSTHLGPDDVCDPVVAGLTRAAAALGIRDRAASSCVDRGRARRPLGGARPAAVDRHPGALLVTEAGGVAETVPGDGSTWAVAGGRALRDDVVARLRRD